MERMNRRAFVTGLGAVLGAPQGAGAQQAGKVYRIGYLDLLEPHSLFEAFRQGLRERGYVEGTNIVIEQRWAEGKRDRLAGLALELVRLEVDAIVASVPVAARAVTNATGVIPVIVVLGGDPVEQGLVATLARPGGNVTGLSSNMAELVPKQLGLLKEAIPQLSSIALLQNPDTSIPSTVRRAEDAARMLALRLEVVNVRTPPELDPAFTAMTRGRADALIVPAEAIFYQHRARIAELPAKRRLPAVYGLREHVDVGGLMAYGASRSDLYRRAAVYVDKILKGAKPSDLPIEQPTKFEFVINLKTAKALGLTIPPSLLLRADRVIE
jgi:putative ABC transport system substrate-binding protein